jgi:YggT family protein
MWGIASIVFGIIEISIGLRFIFKLVGANGANGLVNWIYNVTNPLVAPFSTILGDSTKEVAGTLPQSSFEPAALIALVVYGLIGGILLRVLTRPRS